MALVMSFFPGRIFRFLRPEFILADILPKNQPTFSPGKRFYSMTDKKCSKKLMEIYNMARHAVAAQPSPPSINPKAVFANNELDLSRIDVYGFDYDYTLAEYTEALHFLIYNMAKEVLITKTKYPIEIAQLEYNPNFAVRGLHFDVQRSYLMKINAFHNIQYGAVYRGLTPVNDEEVHAAYEGHHVPMELMTNFYGTGQFMYQMIDLFSLPEMGLISNIIEYLIRNNIHYDPEYLFHDIRTAVQTVHVSGNLYKEVEKNIGLYIHKNPEVPEFIQRLVSNGKKVFLITNSPFSFVDKGMRYIIGDDWRNLFDVVICQARKPKFFNETSRPFRMLRMNGGSWSWDRVNSLKKGEIYIQGNLTQLELLTNWNGSRVLYFGDHVYSDLADATLRHGWRTGAILRELEDEISTLNNKKYQETVIWLSTLQFLMEHSQDLAEGDAEGEDIMKHWLKERDELRLTSKVLFNPYFGSLFRTYHNPTYFSRRLSRFADIYMSSTVNLLNYSMNHTFYPRRSALPHEAQYHVPFELDHKVRDTAARKREQLKNV